MLRSRLIALCGLAALAGAGLAQTSAYYTTQGTAGVGTTFVWQGGGLVNSYTWAAAGEMPIAVGSFGGGTPTVRQAVGQPNSGGPEPGDEYTLAGAPTGFHNLWGRASGNVDGYDAAYNGTNIFMVDWSSGAVYSYDNNFGGGTFMFNANSSDIGITYDSFDNTLWTSNFSSGLVQEWSMSGTAMTSFTDPNGSAAALAFDTTDGTLWMSDGSSATNLYHYSRNGVLLNTVVSNEYLLGGEMLTTPEPAVFVGLGLGVLTLLRRRKRTS